MHSVQEGMWDPQPPSKHGSPLPPRPPSHPRLTHLRSATPAKRITFYKSGDSQFGGVKMAVHKRSFKCFDALLDDLSQKVPLPFGVRTVTTPHGTTKIKHLEQLQDGACYLCSDRRQAKPIDLELASKRQNIWFHNNRRSQRPESASATPPGHLPHRQRRILLLKNTEPWNRRTVVLSRKLSRSLRAFLDEASELLQFHVRKLYTAEGRKIDSVQSLVTCPGVLVCVGREPFNPTVANFLRKSFEEKLPGLGSKSPGLGPRTPGNGARSPPHGAQSGTSEYSEGPDSKKNVNFGLETRKSIIHPRSDSSNRSARFSLSSEKSYVNSLNARPAIMNDDIEKRVLVNKDGSLSVEMKVRFRLQGEETLQWSTQIKKTPTLNSDCSLHQNTSSYLQHTQSGSCSDPDSVAFGPDGVEEANHSHCCYHRPDRHYDLWENPVHSHKQHPVPPPHTSSRTIVRHTHSSSSSSSCNSRRVVRCRAQLTNDRTGQLVQKEMRVTEQVEHRVEMEQDGDTHVEVSSVSRNCSHCEVVLIDGNLSSPSFENGPFKKEDECTQSGVSTCSQVLQSLKDDDDEEDLPPSASQCSHRNEQSPISPTAKVEVNGEEDCGSVRSGMKDLSGRGSRTPNKGRTAKESAPSLDDLNDVKESPSRQSRKSKPSKASDQSEFKRERNHQDLYERPEVDLSPACLPNASPSEVVSNWLLGIPADSSMIEIGDELNENGPEMEAEKNQEKNLAEEGNVCTEEGQAQEEEQDNEGDGALEKRGPSPGHEDAERAAEAESRKNWESSAAVMKVLLTSSLGRCQSLPEVSPIYGRRLSTSAKGLLDCLAQLQLIEPGVGQAYQQRKGCTHPYEDIMVILQSLWLTENRDTEGKVISTDQVSPPRSSSGVGMSSGSGGSGKENETSPKEEESLPGKMERVDKMESGAFSESLETKETAVNRTDVGECVDSQLTSHVSSKLHTEQGAETVDIGPEGASTVLRPPLSKKLSQDPDPVWVLHLLKKLEKQFMNHYTEAMAEFKVRWDLDDSLILDKMITELKQEVKHRVQSSIDREMKKIQGRAGRSHRSPRPPQDMTLSRESSMAEKRRRMLKVMKNQSVKTADSLSDGETTVDLSDQRSEDEYCPCDACVRKKMEARPFKVNPMAVDAPVQMEFDLLKILQLKKAPVPAAPPDSSTPEDGSDTIVSREEGRNLDVVEEEEEEEEEEETEEEKDEQKSETKEDIVADLVLEETIPEEDEGEETDVAAEKEKCIAPEDEAGAAGDEEQCQCDSHEVSDEEDVGDTEAGGGNNEVTCDAEGGSAECEAVTSGEEAAKNDDNESTVEGGQSSSAKDEDEEADDTEEGGTEEQTNGAQEGEEDADAEDSDADKKRPSDSSIDASRASEEDERDNQGDGDDEEGETDDAVADSKPDDDREDKEGALLHQFTRTSVESQPGSLDDPDVDSDPLRTCHGSRKASGGSVGGAGLRSLRSPGGVQRCKPEDTDDDN
ncbi:retinitis pigmentosa 1-like 1 protein [Neosynchiropus ocellatus]